MTNKKILLSFLLLIAPLTLTACGNNHEAKQEQEIRAEQQKEVQMKQQKKVDYQKYVEHQKQLPLLNVKQLNEIYEQISNDRNAIVTAKTTGSNYDNILENNVSLRQKVANKYLSKEKVKEEYSDVRSDNKKIIEGIKEYKSKNITNYRDNTILRKASIFLDMEIHLIKMNESYQKSIYTQNQDYNNSDDIQMYILKINKAYKAFSKDALPIIQQANYQEANKKYIESKANQFEQEQEDDLKSDKEDSQTSLKDPDNQIAKRNQQKAQNKLNSYNAKLK